MITENDQILIAKAQQIDYTEWYEITLLEDMAQTPEGKEQLRTIRCSKYHEDEFRAGML